MTLGLANVLRLCASFFNFGTELFLWLANLADSLGNPEIATHTAVVVSLLVFSKQYFKAAVALAIFSAWDLFTQSAEEHYLGVN